MRDINLMPEEVKPASALKPERSKEKKILGKAVAILVVILIVAAASILSPTIYVNALESRAVSIQAEIDSSKYAEVKSINSKIVTVQTTLDKKSDVINSISQGVQISEILNYAQEAVPKGVSINGMQYNDKQLVISGTAKDRTAVAEYIANLNRLNIFSDFVSAATYSYGKTNSMLEYKLNLSKPGKGV